jgi:malonyl-CoA/methylmalonyl-CoA synthetase
VLLPTSVMTAQATPLIKAWDYSPEDHLLHVLPLHHIHGTINAILAPIIAGSTVEFIFPFNATAVWSRFAAPFLEMNRTSTNGHTNGISNGERHSSPKEKITFFTVVPTVYNRLLSTFSDLTPDLQKAAKLGISPSNLRLNISGSAALPTPTKKAWTDLSNGNVILERYGMTEIGMALSCGLSNADRVDGSVGWPLPTVEVRLVDTETHEVIKPGEETDSKGRERDGEIQLRGPTVFKEYWRNPEATKKEHVDGEDGKGKWFKTGDVAIRRAVPSAGQNKDQADWASGPLYFIRGRLSSDIIKSGGEKVSALEVERELLSLPQIAEAAVVAVPSGKWGQKVGAVVVVKKGMEMSERREGKAWGPLDMRMAMKERLAGYKIPQVMKIVEGIERNAMGKSEFFFSFFSCFHI